MAAIPNWQDAAHRLGPRKGVRVETVVLAVGSGSQPVAALTVAQGLAAVYGATLHVLCLGAENRTACEQLTGFGVSRDKLQGAVVDGVAANADAVALALKRLRAPLLVMSAGAPAAGQETSFSELTESVLRKPVQRVVLIGPEGEGASGNVKRILLAHDGAPSTDVATAEAAELAHRAGAEVLAIHVAARNSGQPQEPGSIPAPRYVDQPQHEWPSWANEFLDRMIALGSPPAKVKFKLMVTGGQPGSEIAHFSRENHADLVVAAWHGEWDDDHGRLLRVVVRRASCPVYLVHAPERKPPRGE